MENNFLNITQEENEKIASFYPGGEHAYYSQVLDKMNVQDAKKWITDDELMGIVSEIHGGIIGYIHHDYADQITSILNLRTIELAKK